MTRMPPRIISLRWFFAPKGRPPKRLKSLPRCAPSRRKKWPLRLPRTLRSRVRQVGEPSNEMALDDCVCACFHFIGFAATRAAHGIGGGCEADARRTIRSGADQAETG